MEKQCFARGSRSGLEALYWMFACRVAKQLAAIATQLQHACVNDEGNCEQVQVEKQWKQTAESSLTAEHSLCGCSSCARACATAVIFIAAALGGTRSCRLGRAGPSMLLQCRLNAWILLLCMTVSECCSSCGLGCSPQGRNVYIRCCPIAGADQLVGCLQL